MKRTFWDGKFGDLVQLLQKDIPINGKVLNKNRPMLEEWRKLQNAYYRYYNDGDDFTKKLQWMAKRFGVDFNRWAHNDLSFTVPGQNYVFQRNGNLEALADAVFEAALLEKFKGATS